MLGRVPVISGNISTTGMFDQKSEITFDDQVVSIENALTVRADELGHLRYGSQVTVGGVAYTVRSEPLQFGDGLLCVMPLERQQPAAVIPAPPPDDD
jgi:hypothetical protein